MAGQVRMKINVKYEFEKKIFDVLQFSVRYPAMDKPLAPK